MEFLQSHKAANPNYYAMLMADGTEKQQAAFRAIVGAYNEGVDFDTAVEVMMHDGAPAAMPGFRIQTLARIVFQDSATTQKLLDRARLPAEGSSAQEQRRVGLDRIIAESVRGQRTSSNTRAAG